ncbi:hypothetical protein NEOLI_003298 [Neolecta irregularis DAH-3]|uniref:Uncharacterized protein n=1 Tax=Neolecta irregularis (strain DAH-3) TaxID=1198029 RepID=A0A1U7LRQ1_NEOID|nr:hypothetical protein NEOLI_003298 [Neolecta irregularis DAH-3]|eukprot:OLL25337.1 hypothetical protein NEOLI_003298 [Neolecta irregularis DAH-3]
MTQPPPTPPRKSTFASYQAHFIGTVLKGKSTLPIWLTAAAAAAVGYYLYNNSGDVNKAANDAKKDVQHLGNDAQKIGHQVDQKIYGAYGQGKERLSGAIRSGQKELGKRKDQIAEKEEEGKKLFNQMVNETDAKGKAAEEKKDKGWFT